jgi:hypothetical protein
MATASEPSATSLEDKLVKEQANQAKKMDYDLAPAEGEAGPSNSNTPSSGSPKEGVSPMDAALTETILAISSEDLETASKKALPPTPPDSGDDGRAPSDKGKGKGNEKEAVEPAAPANTADDEAAKKDEGKEKEKEKEKEKVATPALLTDAEKAQKKQRELEEEEKAKWLERFCLKQPGQKLLSVNDPKFRQLMHDFRVQQEKEERERKAQEPVGDASVNAESKSKLRAILSRFNLRRRLSERRARRS